MCPLASSSPVLRRQINATMPISEPIILKYTFIWTYGHACHSMQVEVSGSVVLSLYLIVPWDQTQVIRLASNCYLWTHWCRWTYSKQKNWLPMTCMTYYSLSFKCSAAPLHRVARSVKHDSLLNAEGRCSTSPPRAPLSLVFLNPKPDTEIKW